MKRGGVANAAQELLSDKAPADGHVAEITRRYILNSDVFANSLDKADRGKLYELEIDARSAVQKLGRGVKKIGSRTIVVQPPGFLKSVLVRCSGRP